MPRFTQPPFATIVFMLAMFASWFVPVSPVHTDVRLLEATASAQKQSSRESPFQLSPY